MKENIRESLTVGEKSFKVPVLEYESTDEATKAAGDPAVVVNRLNNFLYYHGTATDARDLIVMAVEKVSGIKPSERSTGKNKDGKDILEVEGDKPYVNRILTAKPDLFDKAQALVTKWARGYKTEDGKDVTALANDIKVRPPGQKGPKKLADKWKTAALNFLTPVINPKTSKPYNLANLNKAFAQAGVQSFTADPAVAATDAKNVEALGWLCKAYQDAQDAFKSM